MKRVFVLIVALLGLPLLNIAFGQLTLDRTRVIFDREQSNSQSIVVENTNKNDPYLAQSWIEDERGNKIESPLVALPILQRINPGQEKQVKISLVGQNTLPEDRESLLFFNVLGVPPKAEAENQVSIVIQSKIKLFYRPKGLPKYPLNKSWIEEMGVENHGSSLMLTNPTAYHIIIFSLSRDNNQSVIEKDIILKPFSSETVHLKLGSTPTINVIDDYGAVKTLHYQCQATSCRLRNSEE